MFPTVSSPGQGHPVGLILRKARVDAGITLGAMATRTRYSKAYLSNVEAGRRRATPDVILAYQQVLGVDVHRRTLIAGLMATTAAPLAVGELLRHGFTSALGSGIGLDGWADRVEGYGRAYMRIGAGQLQGELARDLVAVQQHLDRPQLWASAARLVALYAKTTPDTTDAVAWYRVAAQLADRSEDPDVRVWVRGRAALALAYEAAELDAAATFAAAALGITTRPSIGRQNALAGLAHVRGALGDLQGAVRADEAAQRTFEKVPGGDPTSDFTVPWWRMAVHRSMLYARLGDPRSLEAAQEADRTRPVDLPRFGTHTELHRALLQVRQGDKIGGLAYGRAAMAALPEVEHSLSLRLMLAEVETAAR